MNQENKHKQHVFCSSSGVRTFLSFQPARWIWRCRKAWKFKGTSRLPVTPVIMHPTRSALGTWWWDLLVPFPHKQDPWELLNNNHQGNHHFMSNIHYALFKRVPVFSWFAQFPWVPSMESDRLSLVSWNFYFGFSGSFQICCQRSAIKLLNPRPSAAQAPLEGQSCPF